MADRNAIITELFDSEWYNRALNTIADTCHRDDLNQEVMVVLLSKPPDEIIKIYESDYFRWYIVRVIMNIYKMPKSKFVTENNRYTEMSESMERGLESISEVDIEELLYLDRLHEMKKIVTAEVVDELYWYDKEIFKLWMANMNAKKIARDTQISHREILRVINEVKEKIRQKLIDRL